VGSPPLGVDQIDYVLGKLSGDETSAIADSLDRAADAVLAWVESGIEQAMNQYNG
jgi:peptidyl-tRNA hydrolase